jgi:ferredoxin
MAERIGISGARDALNQWFGQDFVNRPPISTSTTVRMLEGRINSGPPGKGFRLIAGVSRLALETRENERNSCVACGECMSGCPREAMYSAIFDLTAWRRSGLIARVVFARALAVEGDRPHVIVQTTGNDREAIGPFDRVYVCAGCFGTTELAMRSLELRDGPQIVDNSVYTFPLLYVGRPVSRANEERRYLGLANLFVNAIPRSETSRSAQIQIYPFFDHLWRYFVPFALWPLLESFARALRCRMHIGRLFLHGELSQRYAVHVTGDHKAKISLAHEGTPLGSIPDLWSDVRQAFQSAGFLIPLSPIRQQTSSHYAASLPLGCGPVGFTAEIKPGVYLCDSSVFPTAPAASPTFTIMANARRIAHLSLIGVEGGTLR